MSVTGLRIGAASKNVTDSATVKPWAIKPLATGRLPHSQTGNNTPKKDMYRRLKNVLFGSHVRIAPAGSHTWTTIDRSIPNTTKGKDSIITLDDRVIRSCSLLGSSM